MRASARGLGMLFVLLSAGCESAPLATEPTAVLDLAQVQEGFVLPPGASTLGYSIGSGPRALILAGSPELRILRVTTASGVDIVFTSASPQAATRFFQSNPLPGPNGVTINVNNPTDRSVHLSVSEVQVRRRP